jgi:hypothetical protein
MMSCPHEGTHMMTHTLSDMQLILLATACQRDDGSLLPPPDSLGGQGARIRKAVTALIKRGFASEIDGVDAARTWREDDGHRIGVVITTAGRAVIAAEEPAASAPTTEESSVTSEEAGAPGPSTIAIPRTKKALVLDLLQRDEGADLAELVAATR